MTPTSDPAAKAAERIISELRWPMLTRDITAIIREEFAPTLAVVAAARRFRECWIAWEDEPTVPKLLRAVREYEEAQPAKAEEQDNGN
jgi:hypothetical protein